MKGLMMPYQLTTHAIIEHAYRVFPHKKVVTKLPDGTYHRYTFSDMYRRTKKLANSLVGRLGIQPGERVGTFAWNNYQHLELYYGIPGVGAICHTINIRLSIEQITFIINHAENRVVFIDASLVPLFEKAAPRCPGLEHCVILNAGEGFTSDLPGVLHYEDLLEGQEEEFQWFESDENDACGLCYTSGTTGNPKGALYSHRSTYLHAMAIMMPNAANLSSKERAILIVPQFHVMAWGFPFVCLLAGTEMVMPNMHLQPEKIIEMILDEEVTVANGVPTIWMGVYEALKKNPPPRKLPLKEYLVGGSALSTSLIEAFEKDFGLPGVQAWGMTETSPLGTLSRIQPEHAELTYEEQLVIRGKQGVEMPGVEIRAVNDNGKVLPRDGKSVGEFQVRGAWVIGSYFKLLDNHLYFSEDGWFKTGDVGTIDRHGYMNITDRTKDLIKSGGEWISSVELELAIMAHPSIREACVIAIPDDKWMERPLAAIVLEESKGVSNDAIKDFLSGSFASYQLPDQFVRLAEIPKTSVGKMDKKLLRKQYAEGKLK